MMLKQDDVKTENIYNILPTYENIPGTELLNFSDCIIIYDLVCLDYIRDEIVKQYKYVPSATKYNELKTVQFKFNQQKKNITLVVDPNFEHKGKTDITWKIVRDYCKIFNVEFTNQNYNILIQELKDKHFNAKSTRIKFNKKQRDEFLKQHPTCATCKCNLTKDIMQIDHIVPLAAGGDNEPDNLQSRVQKLPF